MAKWKEKALRAYKAECYKQIMPYQYELLMQDEARGVDFNNPLVSMLGNVVYFPDMISDILDFSYITSEFIVFVHKDGIPEQDLVEKLLSVSEDADIIYPDEDFFDFFEGETEKYDAEHMERYYRTPWRKPDFSPDTLMSYPYIETCFAIRTQFAKSITNSLKMSEFPDEVRVYDFLLKALMKTDRVRHVPEILYHRFLPSELKTEAYEEDITDENIYDALYKRYQRAGYCLVRDAAKSRLGYDDIPSCEDGEPIISVIIPSKDHSEMLIDCISKVMEARDDLKIEFIIVDNGSGENEKQSIEEGLLAIKGLRYQYIYEPMEFNFSLMCNMGASRARGEYLLFLNDDVEAEDTTFLKQMLKIASMPHIGAVGVKLLYPDWESIQHVGVADINRGPSHKLCRFNDRKNHYFGRNKFLQDVLAVTGACLMVSKQKYFKAGGFHDKMKVGYNDIDLCVKLYELGYYNVVDCSIMLIHHESLARGSDAISASKRERLAAERELFYSAHPWLKEYKDPFYSKYLDQDTVDIKVSTVPDYQITDYRNKVFVEKKLIAKPGKKVSFNVEKFDYEMSIDHMSEDAYVFEGWSLVNKSDNTRYGRMLCLIPINEDGKLSKEHIECKVSPKYREDVKEVFPEASHSLLAGFVCRIPVSFVDSFATYQLAMAMYSKGIFQKYVTLGDKFSVEYGIIKDE